MFVNLSSSFPLFSRTLEVIKQDRLKIIISGLAFGVLLSGTIYWIYSRFWQERQLKSVNSPDLHHLFASPLHDSKQMQRQENTEMPQEEIFDIDQDFSKSSMTIQEIKQNQDISLIDTDEIDVDNYLGDLSNSYSDYPSFEKNLKDDLSQFLEEEKNNYCYEHMFLRYEGVKAALEDCKMKNEHEWINFCNVPFTRHHQATEDIDFTWELSISIDPAQSCQAWKILAEELESTNLCLPGRIHSASSEKTTPCCPGKEICLFILKHEERREAEWRQFLSLIASRFYAEGIQPDSRPLNGDPNFNQCQWQAVIPCKGVPTYFSYTHCFQVMNDNLFMHVAHQYSSNLDENKDTIALSEGQPSLVKASYYKTLEEKERHNPVKVYDPFASLIIEKV